MHLALDTSSRLDIFMPKTEPPLRHCQCISDAPVDHICGVSATRRGLDVVDDDWFSVLLSKHDDEKVPVQYDGRQVTHWCDERKQVDPLPVGT